MLSSRPHLALILLLDWGVLNRSRPLWGTLPQWGAQPLAGAPLNDCSLLAASWDWPKTETNCISHGHLHISFYNTHTFPFNHVTASTYFQWCVQCRKSFDWRLGQGSICSTFTCVKKFWNIKFLPTLGYLEIMNGFLEKFWPIFVYCIVYDIFVIFAKLNPNVLKMANSAHCFSGISVRRYFSRILTTEKKILGKVDSCLPFKNDVISITVMIFHNLMFI